MSQRILVIEGDPVLRDNMWRLLRDHGHQVDLAANGAQAAGQLLRSRFDTIIMDLSITDIGASFLGSLSEADGARRQAPSPALIGLVEHRHSLAVSRVCGGVFKAVLSKPLRSGTLIDAIASARSRPAAMGVALPPQGQGRNRSDPSHAARDLSTAHWRRFGLQARPRVFACPSPTPDQEKALKLCFDLASPQEVDLIILLERHGMNDAKRLARSADKPPRPLIALSLDHADLCEAVFDISSETSWRKIASLLRLDRAPSSGVPQLDGLLAASVDVDGALLQTSEHHGVDITWRQKAPIHAEPNVLLGLNQKRGGSVCLANMDGAAEGWDGQGPQPVKTAPTYDREASAHGWSKGARIRAGIQVLLIEEDEKASPDLTLALSRAGHIVCRVQDVHASTLAAAKTRFDVGVIDMNKHSEPHTDLAGLVRSLRSVQRGLPIILVGSDISDNGRNDLVGVGGISRLPKVSAEEHLVEAVSAAIAYGSAQSLASEGIQRYCSPSHRDQVETYAKG